MDTDFVLVERGKIKVKGKGKMTTYFLTGKQTDKLALQNNGCIGKDHYSASEGCSADSEKVQTDLPGNPETVSNVCVIL